jgi:hypothetical protein
MCGVLGLKIELGISRKNAAPFSSSGDWRMVGDNEFFAIELNFDVDRPAHPLHAS